MKTLILDLISFLLGRHWTIRISQGFLNRALGENGACIDLQGGGERMVAERVLNFVNRQRRKFVVFDVGANVGDWMQLFMNVALKKGVSRRIFIHGFEPSKYTFSLLEEKIKSHAWKDNIALVNVGMSSREGSATLHVNEAGGGTSSFHSRRGCWYWQDNETEVATLTTTDEYCRSSEVNRIFFLKIDTEGNEMEVLRGAERMLRQKSIDFIQFEYGETWISSRSLIVDIWDYVTGFGYVLGKILPKGIEFYDRYDERLERFRFANFLVTLPEHVDLFIKIEPWMVRFDRDYVDMRDS